MMYYICSVTELVRENIVSDSIVALRKCFQLASEELPTLTAVSPVSGPLLVLFNKKILYQNFALPYL